jgi:hypothetical protein
MDGRNDVDLQDVKKEELINKLTILLPELCEKMNLTVERLESITEIERDDLISVENGNRKLLWNEYLSILFVLWRDDCGRRFIEEKGLFPDELKDIMTINRKTHE